MLLYALCPPLYSDLVHPGANGNTRSAERGLKPQSGGSLADRCRFPLPPSGVFARRWPVAAYSLLVPVAARAPADHPSVPLDWLPSRRGGTRAHALAAVAEARRVRAAWRRRAGWVWIREPPSPPHGSISTAAPSPALPEIDVKPYTPPAKDDKPRADKAAAEQGDAEALAEIAAIWNDYSELACFICDKPVPDPPFTRCFPSRAIPAGSSRRPFATTAATFRRCCGGAGASRC
jgi:hypothetical protein